MRLRNVMSLALVALATSVLSGRSANAQYFYPGGYGGAGWGGWGGGHTVGGDYARGMGVFAAGAGVYNQQTAVANAINANTVMNLNEYIYQGQLEQNRRYYENRAISEAKRKDASDAIRKRISENPETGDIMRGDALNAILDQVTDPKLGSSSLRLAKTMVPAKTIKEIPFSFASQGVTFSLHQLSSDNNWPLVLKGKVYEVERLAYMKAIENARAKNDSDNLSAEDVTAIRDAVRALRDKIDKNPPQEKSSISEVNAYLRTLAGFAKMLERPSIDRPIAELDKIKEASVGDFLTFMHVYNLRFGPATTASQRAVYSQLYPILAETRNNTLGLKPQTPVASAAPTAPKAKPVDFFEGIPSEHLYDDKKK